MLKKILFVFILFSMISLVNAGSCPSGFPANYVCDDNEVSNNFVVGENNQLMGRSHVGDEDTTGIFSINQKLLFLVFLIC